MYAHYAHYAHGRPGLKVMDSAFFWVLFNVDSVSDTNSFPGTSKVIIVFILIIILKEVTHHRSRNSDSIKHSPL